MRHSQEQINVTSQATTHGNLFHATGVGHLTDEDVFLVLQKKKVEAEITQLKEKNKKDVVFKMGDVGANAHAILQQPKIYTTYTKAEPLVIPPGERCIWNEERCHGCKVKRILDSKKAAPACGMQRLE